MISLMFQRTRGAIILPIPEKSIFSLFSSSVVPKSNTFILNYLTQTFGVSESRVLSSLNVPHVETLDGPNSVVNLFKQYGLLDADIGKAVRVCPQILFLNAEKNLKPKLQFFRDLGFTGPQMSPVLSKSSTMLTHSLEKRIAPSVDVLRGILSTRDLLRVLGRCPWVIKEDPALKLIPNISFLKKTCHIDQSQLLMLLVRQPSLFVMRQSALQDLAHRITEMGVSVDSRMFAQALYSFSCMSSETFKKKFDLLHSYGFSDEQTTLLFQKSPAVFRTSEKKLISGLEFFMNKVGVNHCKLLRYPSSLMYSMEKRVVPRYSVLEVLYSMKLLKKGDQLLSAILLSEEEFLKKYVWKHIETVPELLGAYKLKTEVVPLC
ncbi:mTERF domain-containing protein mitochondrial protein [Dioscorea alata]|uniref:mTERF domain-containing protein mitochondrial protein n=1 Tax=Dioscorea alata TaxID=55571 RepID=A0ACB7TXB9_DIOAL|nr:mTERF domain-containing protein mitochondrial protein [Dioscorea alata]